MPRGMGLLQVASAPAYLPTFHGEYFRNSPKPPSPVDKKVIGTLEYADQLLVLAGLDSV